MMGSTPTITGEMMRYIVFKNDGEDDHSEGFTHLCGTASDYTLCGDTLDGDMQTAGSYDYVDAKKLTCPACIKIVMVGRDRRVKI